MNFKTKIMILGGVAVTVAFLILSALIQDTSAIWMQTRVFGLISFLMLFLTVLLGEIRLLAKDKSKATIFRYHKPIAIFATYLVFLHFISAIADKYKWGAELTFVQYLGFSFSDKWLVFLSLGSIAFYLMLIIGLSSATKSIQLLGFKKWKIIHFLSYATFLIAFIHSVNLGTDIKYSMLAPVVKPVVYLMFAVVTGLLLVRVINSWQAFDDQWEVNLAAMLSVVILVLSIVLIAQAMNHEEILHNANDRTTTLNLAISDEQAQINAIQEEITAKKQLVGGLHG